LIMLSLFLFPSSKRRLKMIRGIGFSLQSTCEKTRFIFLILVTSSKVAMQFVIR
jgi:hypothetical protein